MRKRQDGGLSLTTLSKMLENLKTPKSYTVLRMSSTPRGPQPFTKYLNFCKSRNLIEWSSEIALSGYNIIEYKLSPKGRDFLEMIG